ncbi:MAG: oxygen-independent coproporphyrinogen III oxidase [Acidobacteria bacterium]|nr:oxygen-independent coproporphyrinogen III oxidase [Acidobacteriota bacterium]
MAEPLVDIALSPRQIPSDMLARYSTSAPRYTSYPTAPQFTADFDIERIAAAWRQSSISAAGLSLYIHIPFCQSRCLYCGCFTEIGHDAAAVDDYLAALFTEMDRLVELTGNLPAVEQLALGGGTPVFLNPAQMRRLVAGMERRFTFAHGAERSLEMDPRRLDTDYLDMLVDVGFNRFSFGVQDLEPDVQRKVGRRLAPEKLDELVAHLRRRGRTAVNMDLIYGLPGQTEETFGRTIRRIMEFRPPRIALFGYAHVPWVSPHQQTLEQYHLPNPAERMNLFGLAFEMLLAAGYRHVGMDHFALPEDELIRALDRRSLTRNFMGYTTRRGLDLMGLGASAISSVGRTYCQNIKDIAAYRERAAGGTWVKGLWLSDEDLLRREIILDLFCNFHLDLARVSQAHQLDFKVHFATELEKLRPLADDGLLQTGKSALSVTPLGRFFIRNICMVFDQYLAGEERERRYSRTV